MAVWQMVFGLVIGVSNAIGGRVTERMGADRCIYFGIGGILVAALLGRYAPDGWNINLALVLMGIFPGLIWPAASSTIMRGEDNNGVQRNVMRYNLGWSGGTAIAFFLVTPLMSLGGQNLGMRSLFLPPILLSVISAILVYFFVRKMMEAPDTQHQVTTNDGYELTADDRKIFRHLGWIMNPMGYVILTVSALLSPQFTTKLGLSFESSSMWLSLFFYVRLVCFIGLGHWKGWRYHIPTLMASYFGLGLSILIMILATNLAVFMVGQVVLGICLAIGFHSSLFYSMAGSEEKGEHGGSHEAMVGIGIAIGAFCVGLGSLMVTDPKSPPVLAPGLMGVIAILCGGVAMYHLVTRLSFWKTRGLRG